MDHSKTLLLLVLFYQSTPLWLKVIGGVVGGWVARVILVLVSAQVFWILTLDFRLGLDNKEDFKQTFCTLSQAEPSQLQLQLILITLTNL